MTATTNNQSLPTGTPRGIWRWLTTSSHKDIGILYILTSFFFFMVGGSEAMLIRIQLGAPDNKFVTPEAYNQIFTMHGTTMIFLFAMSILVGFANYIVPLMIGARDMAFPRLNALSYWLFLFGGLLMYSSFFLGGAPDAGWFAYAPLTSGQYSLSHGMDFWALGIILTGVASTVGAINFIVTILNLRRTRNGIAKNAIVRLANVGHFFPDGIRASQHHRGCDPHFYRTELWSRIFCS